MSKTILFLSTVLILIPIQLGANDTTATIAGGVITYKKSDTVSMDSETLKISNKTINVTYEFTNSSDKDVITDVAFPLPPSPVILGDTTRVFPSWDDLYHTQSLLDDIKKASLDKEKTSTRTLALREQSASFTDFTRTVNGEKYGYGFIVQAIDSHGKDITKLLIDNNIPLSATYVGGFMESGLVNDNPNIKKKLKKLKLLGINNKILWQLQISYVWNQTFTANKTTKVTHTYTPHVGKHWLSGKDMAKFEDLAFTHRDMTEDNKIEEKKFTDYCVNETDKISILSMFDKKTAVKKGGMINDDNITYRVQEVRYILSTGANWKGSIKKFRLEIIPPTPTSIVLCCFEAPLKKTSEGIYVCELENFTPKQDLKILFIDHEL